MVNPPPLANPGHSGPTTFFLRSEKDMEKSVQRGRTGPTGTIKGPLRETAQGSSPSPMRDSSFGVQSLEDALGAAFPVENTLSRTTSNVSEASMEAGAEGGVIAGRKRKAGNPVHPKIVATAQRIISSEQPSTYASSAASPLSLRSSESPFRSHLRRGSTSSSVNLSQPLTPLRLSPQPESGMPSTPRSSSMKSFRLSDEEASNADETGSQAIQSSSGEEEEGDTIDQDTAPGAAERDGSMPQLVMPSIAMPARRPFTERGRRMGRLKVMVAGPPRVGKTSLIRSIIRSCEDIVHADQESGSASILSNSSGKITLEPTRQVAEVSASSRPYPAWWSDMDSSRVAWRRKSIADGVLERNLSFVDTPGIDSKDDTSAQNVVGCVEGLLRRTASFESLSDNELLTMLSGNGGLHIDAVIYVFDPELTSQDEVESPQADVLRELCQQTNVIPVIGRVDTVSSERLHARKNQILMSLGRLSLPQPMVTFDGRDLNLHDRIFGHSVSPPFAVSSSLSDDADTMDASLLMSSGYLQPLAPSELSYLIERLFDPDNISRLRHLSTKKFLLWRREKLGNSVDLHKQRLLRSPSPGSFNIPETTATGSLLDQPSQVLVPHSSSSHYRSTSPSAPSSPALSGPSAYTLARYNDYTQNTERFQQVRLAKWAQDLQRSLDNERRRYKEMYGSERTAWLVEKSKEEGLAVVTLQDDGARPAKGRLGGQLGVIDPRDPLGLLAFSQTFKKRGFFALQVLGGCGVVGAVAYWVMRNWVDVQDFFGLNQPMIIHSAPVTAPARGGTDWLDGMDWKGSASVTMDMARRLVGM